MSESVIAPPPPAVVAPPQAVVAAAAAVVAAAVVALLPLPLLSLPQAARARTATPMSAGRVGRELSWGSSGDDGCTQSWRTLADGHGIGPARPTGATVAGGPLLQDAASAFGHERQARRRGEDQPHTSP